MSSHVWDKTGFWRYKVKLCFYFSLCPHLHQDWRPQNFFALKDMCCGDILSLLKRFLLQEMLPLPFMLCKKHQELAGSLGQLGCNCFFGSPFVPHLSSVDIAYISPGKSDKVRKVE